MIIRLLISALSVGITAYLMDTVTVEPWWAAIVVALVLGVINTVIRPIVKLFSLPVNILTLGLFTFVINALMVLLCANVIPAHFHVEGFMSALWFSIILSIVSWILSLVIKK